MAADMDQVFRKAALKAGFVEMRMLSSCVLELRRDKTTPPRRRLPDLMIERGALTQEQIDQLLNALRVTLTTCPECGWRRYVHERRDPARPMQGIQPRPGPHRGVENPLAGDEAA